MKITIKISAIVLIMLILSGCSNKFVGTPYNYDNNSNSNNNVSNVEFYRQVMKEKIKVEEMFHTELKSVAEECYLTNLNKKKAVINLFNISQNIAALIKKSEKVKETYRKKLQALQSKNKKQDKKKKNG